MDKKTFPIEDKNQQQIRDYITKQFDNLSWWPTEGPLQAREEFEALDGSAASLEEWCKAWLDGGQWRQLRVAMEKGTDNAAIT
ncbi:MAG: hypothetical protein RLZZ09_374 [Pseudomonadota bacterium]|jgi:hypothetical protein